MSHSTRLQNITHTDIIRIGSSFEEELRDKLSKENEIEIQKERQRMEVEHCQQIDLLNQKLEDQATAHMKALSEQEQGFIDRLVDEKKIFFVEMEPYVESERAKARENERRLAELQAEKRRSEVMQGNAVEIARLKQSHAQQMEEFRAEQQFEINKAKEEINSELETAKRELGKMRYNEMKQQDYTEEMINDVRRSLLEKHNVQTRDLTANFEAEKFELEQTVKKLDNSLKEKEIELDNSKQSIENQQNLYEKLKDQFKEYILRTRPELTPGQIDFMFEF